MSISEHNLKRLKIGVNVAEYRKPHVSPSIRRNTKTVYGFVSGLVEQ
jgi:hypothetical protein